MLTEIKTKRAQSSNSFVSVIISWLERMGVVKTFDDDPLVLEQDVVEIRQLLDELASWEVAKNRHP